MRLITLKILTNILVAIISIIAIVTAYTHSNCYIQILSIELILIPVLYFVASEFGEYLVKTEYESNLDDMQTAFSNLYEKYIKLRTQINTKRQNEKKDKA